MPNPVDLNSHTNIRNACFKIVAFCVFQLSLTPADSGASFEGKDEIYDGEEAALKAFAEMTTAVVNEAGKNEKLKKRFIDLAEEAGRRNVL